MQLVLCIEQYVQPCNMCASSYLLYMYSCLVQAIFREVVELIIISQCHTSESDVSEGTRDYWRDSLRNTSRGKDGRETTPFRRLIRKMPGTLSLTYVS